MPAASYHVGSRGFVGFEAKLTSADGSTRGTIIPAVALVDSTGADLNTAASPAYFVQGTNGAATAAPNNNQTAVAAASLTLKTSAGNLYGFEVAAGASAGYLMVFDAVSAPADGTVTPKRVYVVAANASFARQLTYPIRCATGITLVFSTTGPFTKTASATAFLAGDYV